MPAAEPSADAPAAQAAEPSWAASPSRRREPQQTASPSPPPPPARAHQRSAADWQALVQRKLDDDDDRGAFEILDELERTMPNLAYLLRAIVLMQSHAFPLAVDELDRLPLDEPQRIDRVRALADAGLARFVSVDAPAGWRAFEPLDSKGSTRLVRYLWPAVPRWPSTVLELTVQPFFAEGEGKGHIIEGDEYRLTAWIRRRGFIAAVWKGTPAPQELAAVAGAAAAMGEELRAGEQLLRDHSARRAAERLTPLADRWPTLYAAEQLALAALVEEGATNLEIDPVRAHFLRDQPMLAELEWGVILGRAGRLAEARKAFEAAIAVEPARPEAYLTWAQLEWGRAVEQHDADRADGLLRMQSVLARLPAHVTSRGAYLSAMCAMNLGSFALTSRALASMKSADATEDSEALRRYLAAIHQDRFTRVGSEHAGGLTLVAYRSDRGPPDDGAIIHHATEVVVLDRKHRLVETFAVSTQAFPPGSPRQTFLDRNRAEGLETVQTFDGAAPKPMDLARALAAQVAGVQPPPAPAPPPPVAAPRPVAAPPPAVAPWPARFALLVIVLAVGSLFWAAFELVRDWLRRLVGVLLLVALAGSVSAHPDDDPNSPLFRQNDDRAKGAQKAIDSNVVVREELGRVIKLVPKPLAPLSPPDGAKPTVPLVRLPVAVGAPPKSGTGGKAESLPLSPSEFARTASAITRDEDVRMMQRALLDGGRELINAKASNQVMQSKPGLQPGSMRSLNGLRIGDTFKVLEALQRIDTHAAQREDAASAHKTLQLILDTRR
jgi:hypothetical protein